MICVQARSTSTRLPGKCLEMIDTKTMTEHVLDACHNTAKYINKNTHKHGLNAFVVLLVPVGDSLADHFNDEIIFEGPEHDVLSRFMLAVNEYHPNYVVRLTADCPLMSPPLITKHIMCASKDGLDYCSNVDDDFRTFIDGWDVEVMSLEMMCWLDKNATTDYDREHVTPLARKAPPRWAQIGAVLSAIDFSDVKLSVDTAEELERVRLNRKSVNAKINRAEQRGLNVYKF